MAWKPWLGKDVKSIRKSTEIDYPPKRKKAWLANNIAEMENLHYKNFMPWGGEAPPSRAKQDITWIVILSSLTGSPGSLLRCGPDPDGSRKFEIIFLRSINGGAWVRVENAQFVPVFTGDANSHTIEGNIVTVSEEEPGGDMWTIRAVDLDYQSTGLASGNIWMEEKVSAYKYWRLLFTEDTTGTGFYIGEVELIGTDGEFSLDGDWEPPTQFALFDGNVSSGYNPPHGSLPIAFRYTLKSEALENFDGEISSYTIHAGGLGDEGRGPGAWTVERSLDGIDWEVMHAVTGEPEWTSATEKRTYNI